MIYEQINTNLHSEIKRLYGVALDTVICPEISAVHRIAATDLLCGLLERCGASPYDEDHSLLWKHGCWRSSFQVILERSDNIKAKSTRQLLTALTTSLRKGRERDVLSLRVQDKACQQLSCILLDYSDQAKAKPALQLLAKFLSNDILSVHQLIAYIGQPPSTETLVEPAGYLFSRVLAWVPHNELSAAAGHLAGVLVQKFGVRESSHEDGIHINASRWVEPLVTSLKEAPGNLQSFKNYVFRELFTRNIHGYRLCLEHLHFPVHLGSEWFVKVVGDYSGLARAIVDDLEEAVLLFSVLQVGKEMGLVREAGTLMDLAHECVAVD